MTHSPDRGSAVVEFVLVAVGILVPALYIGTTVATLLGAVGATTQAVREAGRAFSEAATAEQGRRSALAAARLAFEDHGLSLPARALGIDCGGPCLVPGSTVHVTLAWDVPLPWVPPMLLDVLPAVVPVVAEQRLPIDDLRSDPA